MAIGAAAGRTGNGRRHKVVLLALAGAREQAGVGVHHMVDFQIALVVETGAARQVLKIVGPGRIRRRQIGEYLARERSDAALGNHPVIHFSGDRIEDRGRKRTLPLGNGR